MVKIRLRRMGAKKAPFYRVVVADSLSPTGETLRMNGFSLPVYGRHNVLNALAAVSVGLRLGISEEHYDVIERACKDLERQGIAINIVK